MQDVAEDTGSEAADVPHVPKYDPPQLNTEPADSGSAEDTTEDDDAVEPAKGMPLSLFYLPRLPTSLNKNQCFQPIPDSSVFP